MEKVFGTDGIRGKANVYPMTPEMALRVGKATGLFFQKKNKKKEHSIVIGKDTRLSGYMLETALTSGIVAMGTNTLLVGPIPTPAISHLTKSLNCDAGIVISASHNPSEDNGIKIFDSQGFKLSKQAEQEIESMVLSRELNSSATGHKIGKAYRIDDARGRYIEFVKNSIDNTPLNGLRVVMDCANGAAYHIAPSVFSELGANTIVLNNKPNGYNINKECGALYPNVIRNAVKENNANLGIAFDGDADRVIVCDEKSNLVDGDKLLAILAVYLKKKKALPKNAIVATVMSNLGLDKAMEKKGIKVFKTRVGDKFVIEKMKKENIALGGEQSGHIIFREHSSTGDGLICALQISRILMESNKKLSELASILERFPQKLLNVKVREKKPFSELRKVKKEIEKAERKLGKKGRVLVRYSGTEKKARVMVEAPTEKTADKITKRIGSVIEEEIGA